MHRRLRAASSLAPFALLVATLSAHGGGIPQLPPPLPPPALQVPDGGPARPADYPGPPNQPAGPSTPRPGGPTGPAALGPTPAPSAPGPRGPATPRGVVIEADLTSWDIWWELNKGPWLREDRAADAVATGSDSFYLGATRRADGAADIVPVSEHDVSQAVIPALHEALQAGQRSITNACLLAIAKVGRDHPQFDAFPVIAQRLGDGDREIAETAAFALGLSASTDPRFRQLLTALALDEPAGRKACGREHVDDRLRAYALWGLGLLARGSRDAGFQRAIFATLRQTLQSTAIVDRNVEVAAIQAVGQLEVDRRTHAGQALLDDACSLLLDAWQRPRGVGDQLVQAHCPTALARLLGKDHARSPQCRRLFARELRGELHESRTNALLAQSAALALGAMGLPAQTGARDDDADAVAATLLACWRTHKDAQTRAFAILALGQIGGSAARAALLGELVKARKVLELPWVATAMGELAARERRAARSAGREPAADVEFGAALLSALGENKVPGTLAAVAVAIGRCGYVDAVDELLALGQRSANQDDLAGHTAIALALLGDRSAIAPLRDQLLRSLRRPLLLRQLALAFGRLGDGATAIELVAMLRQGDVDTARLNGISAALGQIRDRRSVPALVDCLRDGNVAARARAFAAEALGTLAARDDVPWTYRYSLGINYRAGVETMSDAAMGVLSWQ